MGVLLLAFLFVFIIPLAEGCLIALLLREIYLHHPLPLGGAIASLVPRKKPEATADEIQETSDVPAEIGEENSDLDVEEVKAILGGSPQPEVASTSESTEKSVFEGAKNTPEDLPVSDVLEAMTAEVSATISNDLERRIEEAARSEAAIPGANDEPNDDLNQDDLLALADALPKKNLNFAKDIEADAGNSDAISPMAKELLGENFDFNALERQFNELSGMHPRETTVQTVKNPEGRATPVFSPASAPVSSPASSPASTPTSSPDSALDSYPSDTGEETSAKDFVDTTTDTATATAIDVQEDEWGNVQASSPFMFSLSPQLADFTIPQTIISSFSGDWIQEMDGSIEPIEGDASRFCFSEELRPMFVRKRKNK